MSKILLSVIGRGRYIKEESRYDYFTTWYSFREKIKYTKIPSDLIKDAILPDQICFIGTDQSLWSLVDEIIGDYQKIEIPYGNNEDEWWAIFNRITDIRPNKGDEIYIDITHGFRSQPFFIFLSIIYFEKVFDARIKGIYYGNYENKYKQFFGDKEVEIAPIVDISPCLELKDWIEGYALFKNFGDAKLIAKLLNEKQNLIQRQNKGNKKLLPTKIKSLGKALIEISTALGLNYANVVADKAKVIERIQKDVSSEITNFLKAFDIVQDQFFESIHDIVGDSDLPDSIVQLNIARWYFEHDRFTQCVLLLREIPLTFCVELLDESQIYNRDLREGVSRKLYADLPNKYEFFKLLSNFYREIQGIRNKTGHTSDEGLLKLSTASEKIFSWLSQISDIVHDTTLRKTIKQQADHILEIVKDQNKLK